MPILLLTAFLASKCDDISCGEVVRALNLEDEPELEDIESRMEDNASETRQWKRKKDSAEAALKCRSYLLLFNPWLDVFAGVDRNKSEAEDALSSYEAGLKALEDGQSFVPGAVGRSKGGESGSRGSKRKKSGKSHESPRKRKRTADSDSDDDFIVSDDDFADSDRGDEKNSDEDDEDEDDEDDDAESGSHTGNDESEAQEEMSIDAVKAKIEECRRVVKAARESRVNLRKERKEAVDRLSTLKKILARLQREKNAFCSLKRSEVRVLFCCHFDLRFVMIIYSFLGMCSRKIFEWV